MLRRNGDGAGLGKSSLDISMWLQCEPTSIVDRLIGRGPEVDEDARSLRRFHEALRHEDPDHVFPGIRIAGGAQAAIPAEPAHRPQLVTPGGDRNAEPPSPVVAEEDVRPRLLRGGQLSVVMSSTEGRDRMRPRVCRPLFNSIWQKAR